MGLLRYLLKKKSHETKQKQVEGSSHHSHLHWPFHSHSHSGSNHGSSHQSSRNSYSDSHEPSTRHSSSGRSGTSRNKPSVDDFIDHEHEKRMVEAFRIIDKDGDGKISMAELGLMWHSLGENITDEELFYMIRDADSDGDGLIDFQEFAKLQKIMGMEDDEEMSREIKLAFNVADVDHSGRISAAELQKVLKQLGQQKVTLAECVDMCNLVDDDGDGMISYEEFERLMKSTAFAH
ncbi:hypothetical protein R1flu_011378 [Riccia fluitans]|uniref:EF-hand domain-containing protein n=1 Tax=Riccia fluitans TaxID=41844 RepID=A0ABD1Z7M6_9MARC